MNAVSRYAIAADCIFDSRALHRHRAVLVEGAQIAGIVARAELDPAVPVHILPAGAWLAPGFIDTQVNGGGDALFNDAPSVAVLERIAAAHRRFGTTGMLATLISDTPDKMRSAHDAVQAALLAGSGILGIHFEGPFLSPQMAGVHDPSMLRRPSPADLDLFTGARFPVLATLAPEVVPEGFISRLTAADVRVAIGHTQATYADTRRALSEGATGFTHLFNAMRPMASREGGVVAAALETPEAYFGMIVDGIHVDPVMLRLALRGLAKPMLVTDAMPPVGGRRATFSLAGHTVAVSDGCCRRGDGRLAGSALSMAKAVANSVRLLHVPLVTALRFASTAPAEFLGLGDRLGRLAAGYRADMVGFLPDSVEVLETWVSGRAALGPERAQGGAAG
jgi:N-acetylglucosamine-6-phosphate deacetylase